MRAYERFLRYVKIHTTSDPKREETHPSTQRQFDLAKILVDEMKTLGIQDARCDEKCYVYGSLPATPGCEKAPAIGWIAHMDTSPDASGENVRPLLHENYDGGDVKLPSGRVIPVETFPALKALRGKTLITASGDTLLGADDKAGIAEILTAVERVIKENRPHGKLCVAFTPDEEIGTGAEEFDVKGFGANYAYTLDGGEIGEVEYETFNAAKADVYFTGVEVHPGEAKDIMINALGLAIEFDDCIPKEERPEHTQGREGYYHLYKMAGAVDGAYMEYLLRDHDKGAFQGRIDKIKQTVAEINRRHNGNYARCEIKLNYRNMGEVIKRHMHLIDNARKAIEKAGLRPVLHAARGGTDGSALSFMGLPCPNLGTGGHYFHGPNECIAAEDMDKAVEIILGIIDLYAQINDSSSILHAGREDS